MTFDEAMERYDGEWLVLRIVSEDKLRRPETVQVAARAADRTAAYAALDLLRSEEPKATFWVWEAAWCIRTGEQMRRTLAQVSEFYEGEPFVWPGGDLVIQRALSRADDEADADARVVRALGGS